MALANACSFLYGAGGACIIRTRIKRIGTYILASEPGTTLIAAGCRLIGRNAGTVVVYAIASARR